MNKGQLSILLIGILIAVTLTVMGIFARDQFDELELQRAGIEAMATSVKIVDPPPTPILNLRK